jgi:hypothetical protein
MELCQSSGSKCVIRLLFETYGDAFMHYLASTSSILDKPVFETAIAQLLRNDTPLTDDNKAQFSQFELTNQEKEEDMEELKPSSLKPNNNESMILCCQLVQVVKYQC